MLPGTVDERRGWLVGTNYTSAWDMPELRSALALRSSTARQALAQYLHAQRGAPQLEEMWARMRTCIERALLSVEIIGEAVDKRRRRFELVRFDFVIDELGEPILTEVSEERSEERREERREESSDGSHSCRRWAHSQKPQGTQCAVSI